VPRIGLGFRLFALWEEFQLGDEGDIESSSATVIDVLRGSLLWTNPLALAGQTHEVCHRRLLVQVWPNANPFSLESVILGDRVRVAHPTNELGINIALFNCNFRYCTESVMGGVLREIEQNTYNRCHGA